MALQTWGASCLLAGMPTGRCTYASSHLLGCASSGKEAEGVLHGGALHSLGLFPKLASAGGTLPAFPGVPDQK